MQALDLNNITLTGELAFRLGRNYSRLEDPMYRAAEIFQADKQGWPGDWEGRTILALCLHERISGRKAAGGRHTGLHRRRRPRRGRQHAPDKRVLFQHTGLRRILYRTGHFAGAD